MNNALIIVALGANQPSRVGNPQQTLDFALKLIAQKAVIVARVSSWWRTPAVPAESGPDFVNGVAVIKCNFTQSELMTALHNVENQIGRVRDQRWGPRVCDIDLIAWDDVIAPGLPELSRLMALGANAIDEPAPSDLILPHPRMHERAFVLAPMAEVAPDWRHPVLGLTTEEMLAKLPSGDRKGMARL